MEPKRNELNLGPEFTGASIEQPGNQLPEHESTRKFEIGHEAVERQGETAGGVVSTTTLPPPLFVPAPLPSVVDNTTAHAPLSDDTPVVAGDEDLIEKEWVDKAKNIISQTKDDPYRREQEVSKLQADYLRKRYGRELGASQ